MCRSQSTHPFLVEHCELIHKIGVTGSKVETRIAAAATNANHLPADVEIVAGPDNHPWRCWPTVRGQPLKTTARPLVVVAGKCGQEGDVMVAQHARSLVFSGY